MKKLVLLFIIFLFALSVFTCLIKFNNEKSSNINTTSAVINSITADATANIRNDGNVKTDADSVSSEFETTINNYLCSYQDVIVASLNENPDILGGMFADLNFDNLYEVVFIIDTPMGKMYTINYLSDNSLIETGEIYYWGHWESNDKTPYEIKIYMYEGTYFYCTEKKYSIKDVASAVGVEITAYYNIGNDVLPYEINILTYQNLDFSDETLNEMEKIFQRDKSKIEKCELVSSYSINMEWTRDDYLQAK